MGSQDQPLPETGTSSSHALTRIEEVFRLAFSNDRVLQGEPSTAVLGEVQAFRVYVTQLAQRLDRESRILAVQTQDAATLVQKARELLQIERQRHQAFQPYLGQPQPAGKAVTVKSWEKIRNHLREAMAQELEAVRDARLRLEFRSAELVNQRAPTTQVTARIVLKGGAQVKLHFGRLKGHATQKA